MTEGAEIVETWTECACGCATDGRGQWAPCETHQPILIEATRKEEATK